MDSNSPTLDPTTGVISFTVGVAGKAIPCRVSADWLRDAYGAEAIDDGDVLGAFQRRRANVEAAALRAWLASRGTEPVCLKLDHVCFRVEPFDPVAIRRTLEAAGIEAGPVEQRYGAEGSGPSIYLRDPEGNVVELKGPPDG